MLIMLSPVFSTKTDSDFVLKTRALQVVLFAATKLSGCLSSCAATASTVLLRAM